MVYAARVIHKEIYQCSQCPYLEEGISKGWPNGTFRCSLVVLRDGPNLSDWQHKVVPDKTTLPDWCPLDLL